MCVIRKFATKVAITPERIPFHRVPCVPVDRHKGDRLPFVPCLFNHDVSCGHVNNASWARALAETACHVTIGLEQDLHTHLVCTLAHQHQRRSQSQVTRIPCICATPIWTFASCSLRLSSAISFKTTLMLHSGNCIEFFSIVMNRATSLHTQFDEGAEAWQQGFRAICANSAYTLGTAE